MEQRRSNPELLRELSHARDKFLRLEGAAEQADRGVEAARGAARRARELADEGRKLVDRLEAELASGESRTPLIDAIERGTGRPAAAAAGAAPRPGDGRSVECPGAWTVESLLDAAEELWEEEKSAATLDDVVICSECLAARRAGEPACPECGQDIFRAASTYLPPAAPRPKEDAKAAPDVPERAQGRGTARPPAISCEDLGHPRPWTDAELDQVLLHACRHYAPGMGEFWSSATDSGADDDMILFFLRRRWPQSGRVFVGTDRTKGKFGYTISATGNDPMIWVGPFAGPGHRCTLRGEALGARIRRIFGIPHPSEVVPGPPPGVEDPRDEAGLRGAVAAIEGPAGDGSRTWICLRCGAARPMGKGDNTCPKCRYAPRRTALGLLEDLARGKPDQDPSGITIGGRPLPPPPKRDRKAERDRRAAREAAGKEAPRVV